MTKETCPSCGKPNMTERHRLRCLRKSERVIMKQLKNNKKKEEKTGKQFSSEYEKRMEEIGAKKVVCMECQTEHYIDPKSESILNLCPACIQKKNMDGNHGGQT